MIKKFVEVEVEVEACDILDEIPTDDLVRELSQREDTPAPRHKWNQLYTLLASRRDQEAISVAREMVEAETGRIVP